MYKKLLTATLLSTAMLAAPVTQAASYQDRAMTTGAVVGATSGAMIGSQNNQAVEGAIFGAVLGTIAGAVIASNQQPVTVVHTHRRPVVQRHVYHHPRPVVKRHVYHHPRPAVKRHARIYKKAKHHRVERSHHARSPRYDRDRHVAKGYGKRGVNRWGHYKNDRREMRGKSERRDRDEHKRGRSDHRS